MCTYRLFSFLMTSAAITSIVMFQLYSFGKQLETIYQDSKNHMRYLRTRGVIPTEFSPGKRKSGSSYSSSQVSWSDLNAPFPAPSASSMEYVFGEGLKQTPRLRSRGRTFGSLTKTKERKWMNNKFGAVAMPVEVVSPFSRQMDYDLNPNRT